MGDVLYYLIWCLQVRIQTGFHRFTNGNRSYFFNKYIVFELLQSNYNMKIYIDEIILVRGKWVTQNTWKWHLGEPKSKNSFGGTSPSPTLDAHTFAGASVIEKR